MNPIDSTTTSEELSGISDIDPDINILPHNESLYYQEDSFNQALKGNPKLTEQFSLLFLNIRSAPKNSKTLCNYLNSLNINFLDGRSPSYDSTLTPDTALAAMFNLTYKHCTCSQMTSCCHKSSETDDITLDCHLKLFKGYFGKALTHIYHGLLCI